MTPEQIKKLSEALSGDSNDEFNKVLFNIASIVIANSSQESIKRLVDFAEEIVKTNSRHHLPASPKEFIRLCRVCQIQGVVIAATAKRELGMQAAMLRHMTETL